MRQDAPLDRPPPLSVGTYIGLCGEGGCPINDEDSFSPEDIRPHMVLETLFPGNPVKRFAVKREETGRIEGVSGPLARHVSTSECMRIQNAGSCRPCRGRRPCRASWNWSHPTRRHFPVTCVHEASRFKTFSAVDQGEPKCRERELRLCHLDHFHSHSCNNRKHDKK